MKHRIACTLAVATVSTAASADFVGVVAEDVSADIGTPVGLATLRLYAVFDDPSDQLLAISGNADVAGLHFSTDAPDGLVNAGGGFSGLKQEDFTWFPAVGAPWDSWVTIGASTLAGNDTDYTPGFAGSDGIHNVIKGTEFSQATNGGWFDSNLSTPALAGADGRVLIAQFTIGVPEDGSAQIELSGTIDWGWPAPTSEWFSVSACPVDIPPCYGGCCIFVGGGSGYRCYLTTEGRCDAEGGTFYGEGNDCTGCAPHYPCQQILPAPCEVCTPDLDGNGLVDFIDLLAVLSAWGPCPPECPADFDGSGDVGFEDLATVLSWWGTCPQPGTCCLPSGACVQSDSGGYSCTSQGGVYFGDGTLCADVTCPQPGACCLPDGSCGQSVVGGAGCASQGGIYLGDDTLCADVTCPQPGACCLPDGSCIVAVEFTCLAAGGTFAGEGGDCSSVVCSPPPCTFADPEVLSTFRARFVAAGDLDGDEDLDLAVANQTGSNSYVSILLNAGDGTFAPGGTYGYITGPMSVAVGDLDGDEDLDLAVGGGDIWIFLNHGDGTFAAEVTYDFWGWPFSVALGDMDGDLDLDLAVADAFSDEAAILLNHGDGTFAAEVRYSAGNDPYSVAIGDLDGDLDLDLAVANEDSHDVSILLNSGDGTFAPDVTYGVEFFPISIAVGDLDGDEDLDIAVDGYDHEVSVLLNHGNGTFAAYVPYGVGAGGHVAIGDLDGDLDLDLAVADAATREVSALLNDGNGAFFGQITYDAGGDGRCVAVGDLDGDLDVDLAVACVNYSFVSILLNDCSPPPCHADLDGSGDVGYEDLVAVLSAWGPCPPSCPPDLDGSGDVGFGDLLLVLGTWGPCPG